MPWIMKERPRFLPHDFAGKLTQTSAVLVPRPFFPLTQNKNGKRSGYVRLETNQKCPDYQGVPDFPGHFICRCPYFQVFTLVGFTITHVKNLIKINCCFTNWYVMLQVTGFTDYEKAKVMR